jgi:hypothetical protein
LILLGVFVSLILFGVFVSLLLLWRAAVRRWKSVFVSLVVVVARSCASMEIVALGLSMLLAVF